MKVPAAVGVPLIVIVLVAQCAETPAGSPLAPDTPSLEIPVAPVVVWVIEVSAVLTQSVGVEEAALAVFTVVVVRLIEPELLLDPHTLYALKR